MQCAGGKVKATGGWGAWRALVLGSPWRAACGGSSDYLTGLGACEEQRGSGRATCSRRVLHGLALSTEKCVLGARNFLETG